MKALKLVTPLIFVTLTTGCATIPEAGTPEARIYIQEQRMEQAGEIIEQAPEWFTKAPCSPTAICTTATAVSLDMQLAVDKAVLDAKYTLADKIKGIVSAKISTFIEQVGNTDMPTINTETTKVVKNVISNISTTGYEISKQSIQPSKQGFRAYVLAEYPLGSANRQLVAATKQNKILNSVSRANKAFSDLESEILAAK